MDETKFIAQPRQHTNLQQKASGPSSVEAVIPSDTAAQQALHLPPYSNPYGVPGLPELPGKPVGLPGIQESLYYANPWIQQPPIERLFEQPIRVPQPHFQPSVAAQQPIFDQPRLHRPGQPFTAQQPQSDPPITRPIPEFYQPSTGGESRPFTTMIDQLIAEEKRKTPTRDAPSGKTKKCLKGIGPLSEPILSSTQQSDLESDAGPLDEFKPLESDHSSKSESSAPKVTFAPDPRAPTPESDGEFVNYLKTLESSERQRHLMHTREVLMAEQRRLQAVLVEQEGLLLAKQKQLHQQQEVQRHRLAYFERTGRFPSPGWDGTLPPPKGTFCFDCSFVFLRIHVDGICM